MKKLLSDDRKPGVDKDGKVVPKVVPAVNQIELHPYVWANSCSFHLALITTYPYRSCVQQDIVDYCTNHGISLTAYSPLGSSNSPLLQNAVVQKLAEKHKVQPANILISLQANRPHITGETGERYFQETQI